jgi:hypothetical protein
MLKKKILTPQAPTKTAPTSSTKRTFPPAKAVIDDEGDEDDDTEVEEDDEEEAPVKKSHKIGAAKGGNSRSSALADAFDSTSATGNADDLPAGKYEAIFKSGILQEPDAKGQSVRVSFELCHPDLQDNNQVTTWFKLFDASENKVEGGIRAFKGTLAKLGYKATFDELEDILAELTEERPGVMLKISYSKDRDGNVWQRAVVESLCDNQIVQEYKDNVPY